MKLALESAALLIFFLCFSTALKAFLHLRHHEWRLTQRHEGRVHNLEVRKHLDRVA